MPQYRRKGLKRSGRGLKQFKSAFPTSGGSGLANAVKFGIGAAGMTNVGRRIANRLMNLRKTAQSATQVIRKKKLQTHGHLQNHTEKSRISNLSRYRTKNQVQNALVRSGLQYSVYKWNGVKDFDNNGFYALNNYTDPTGARLLPLYMFDLTSCRNTGTGGATITAAPLLQMYQNAVGGIYFVNRAGLQPDGSTSSNYLQLETSSSTAIAGYHPHARDMLSWASIKMNLWGCKNRSTKFLLQLVQIKEDDLCPSTTTETNTSTAIIPERTAFYQSLIKPFVYNPIATTSAIHSKKLKVLKSETFIIDSISTTEQDQDPNVKCLKWFVRFNKICNYVESSNYLLNQANTCDEADFAQNSGEQFSTTVTPRQRVYLMIRSTNFGQDAADFDNANTPSFDLQVGLKHQNFN